MQTDGRSCNGDDLDSKNLAYDEEMEEKTRSELEIVRGKSEVFGVFWCE